MTSKIVVFNGALRMCGERKLASLTENREPRRLLDDEWADGAVDYCLGAGQWKFAKRTVEIASSVGNTPAFGYANAFEIPTDLIRTTALCSDERLDTPLLAYSTEQNFWFADVDPIYVSYVSNGASYGGDLSTWPPEFVLFVEAYLAGKIVTRLTQDKEQRKMTLSLEKKYLSEARSSDAMEGPTAFPPQGSWVSARLGRSGRSRGSRSQLIG
jgi:hypothetical protein